MKRIAVVTGGGRGIGRAAAEALSADGWTVVVCGRTADVLEDTAASLAGDSLPVVADVIEGYAGPLAGVLTGLEWAAENIPDAAWVASLATDAPFLPGDLVARMISAVKSEGADLACAASVGRMHPVFGLWPLSLRADLRAAMIDEDIRKIDLWTARYNLAVVEFEKKQGRDPFFNVNQPDNLAEAGRIIAGPG